MRWGILLPLPEGLRSSLTSPMHLEVLVEEPSAEIALRILIPKIVGENTTFRIHPFQGKQDLVKNLLGRLRGYRRWLPSDWRVVVLIDEDREDCLTLKSRLENAALDAGLQTKSSSASQAFQVISRLAIEELEAWYFGDTEAISTAFPRVPQTLANKARYRNPDAITGGTWESLERVLQRAGYYRSGMSKLDVARKISFHMNPTQNRSRSFQVFRDALSELAGQG